MYLYLPRTNYLYFRFVLQNISSLLHDPIRDPPAYFWGKIIQSLEVVQRATGRSIDDVVLIVHLIIQEIGVFGQGPIVHQGGKTYTTIHFQVIFSSQYN